MAYKGIVKGHVIELEEEVTLPEGTRVSIIPEQPVTINGTQQPMSLKAWLQEARQVRAQLPRLVIRWKSSESFERSAPADESNQGSSCGCQLGSEGRGHRTRQ